MSRLLRLGSALQQSSFFRKLLRTLGLSGLAYSTYRRLAARSAEDGWRKIRLQNTVVEVPDTVPVMHVTDEMPVIEDLVDRLESGDVFYDIGAHIGIYTAVVGKAVANASIIAVEPIPESQSQLQTVASHNEVEYEIYDGPLTETPRTVPMQTNADGNNRIVEEEDDTNTEYFEGIPGDQLAQEESLPTPDIVKIDVEGAEMDVILGMEDLLTDKKSCIVYVEIHPDQLESFGYQHGDVRKVLEEYGYEVVTLMESINGRETLRAER